MLKVGHMNHALECLFLSTNYEGIIKGEGHS